MFQKLSTFSLHIDMYVRVRGKEEITQICRFWNKQAYLKLHSLTSAFPFQTDTHSYSFSFPLLSSLSLFHSPHSCQPHLIHIPSPSNITIQNEWKPLIFFSRSVPSMSRNNPVGSVAFKRNDREFLVELEYRIDAIGIKAEWRRWG